MTTLGNIHVFKEMNIIQIMLEIFSLSYMYALPSIKGCDEGQIQEWLEAPASGRGGQNSWYLNNSGSRHLVLHYVVKGVLD